MDRGNESLLGRFWSCDQHGRHGKTPLKYISREPKGQGPWCLVCIIADVSQEVCLSNGLGLTLNFLTERSNLIAQCIKEYFYRRNLQ